MCKNNSFRTLNANEIECRVAQGGRSKNGVWASYLLYKDARVDQRVMDETFGPMNWQATYEVIDNLLFCRVSIWDSEKKCWVSKMNVGTESNTEKEKGLASDCLKRACFTWGLGVELYSSPKIFVNLQDGEYDIKNDKVYPKLALRVDAIEYDNNRKVAFLRLKDSKGATRYESGSSPQKGPKNAKESTKNVVFVSADGKKAEKGGKVWLDAIAKTAAGKVCDDGTPIPIFFADYFNVPDADMRDFISEVKKLKGE